MIFDRIEQEEQTTRIQVRDHVLVSHRVPSKDAGNPSDYRDGIRISFHCETCQADPIELTFAQHKGATLMGWRFLKPSSG